MSDKITGDIIQDWKMYTLQYFKYSSCAFLQESQFFQNMSDHMKVKIVKGNLLVEL